MSYTNTDGSDDTIEDLQLSARCFAGALGALLQEDEGIVIHLQFQPNFPDDRHGRFVVWKGEGQIHIFEIDKDDPMYELKHNQLLWMKDPSE